MSPKPPSLDVSLSGGPLLRDAIAVVRELREAGHESVFAGGCVRDEVLGNAPYDYDIATSATPEEVLALFKRTVPVGAAFGVVRVLIGDHEFEVATYRTEGGYSDGRRPDTVSWATARDDVLRRDFTINGLLLDPLEGEGTVIDHVGGLDDLRDGVIRAIGEPDERFEEDKLRLLRAVRFAARLKFTVEERTWEALRARAHQITSVSVERIRDELERMCTQSAPSEAFRLLRDSGLWGHVLPEIEVTESLLGRIDRASVMDARGAWTLICSELVPGDAVSLCKRMKLSTAHTRHVEAAVEILRAIPSYRSEDLVARKRLLRREEVSTALAILALDEGPDGAPPGLVEARGDLTAWSREALHPAPLVSGADLIAAGRSPGPGFKLALEAVEDAQLLGQTMSRDEALVLALQKLDES